MSDENTRHLQEPRTNPDRVYPMEMQNKYRIYYLKMYHYSHARTKAKACCSDSETENGNVQDAVKGCDRVKIGFL
jgi:hypothetical protein